VTGTKLRKHSYTMGKKASGVLLHITSLPSKYGIGDFGPEAYKFADFLARAKQHYWQILPLNPPTFTENPYSPYNSLSAFAGNSLLISPDLLYRQGFLEKKDIKSRPVFPEGRVDYRLVNSYKMKLLNTAYGRFKCLPGDLQYEQFCSENKGWLEDYATFVALRRYFKRRLWCNWPVKIRDRNDSKLNSMKVRLQDSINREKFIQYVFYRQWFSLKGYCNEHGIRIIGDIPIYVSYDSADVWVNPELFKLTKSKKARFIAGVPPDFFSQTGQLWGNPVYNWRASKNSGYRWWIERVKHNLALFDNVRIDHFRGFVAYWQVPAGGKNAVKGRWVKGANEDFFHKLFRRFPISSFIAEDLGYITSDVRATIEKFKPACMRVLLFGFGGDYSANPHYPDNHVKNCVVYSSTHDTNTVKGWFDKEATPDAKKRLSDYLGRKVSASRVCWEFIQAAMNSPAHLVIVPMQDVLGLGEESRMNRPATIMGNWRWRLRARQINSSIVKKMEKLTVFYGRS